MTEAQRDKNEELVKAFLKEKRKRDIKIASKKNRKYLQIDFYLGNTPVKFEAVKEVKDTIRFRGVEGMELGWFKRSRARLLALYVEKGKVLYLMSLPGIRRYVRETKAKMVDGCYEVDLNLLKVEKLVEDEFVLGIEKKATTAKKKTSTGKITIK